jgi:hypothetical protein
MRRAVTAVLVAVLVLVGVGGGVGAQEPEQPAQPTITVSEPVITPGQTVVITLAGFRSEVVTVAVCGNAAARQSTDCNQVASEGVRFNRDGSLTQRSFVVMAPATTCPCVLRASTLTNDEVAYAAIELVGHPVGPIVRSEGVTPLRVRLGVERAPQGIGASMRSAFGGPTTYDVTVTVQNRSGEVLEHVAVAGSAGRSRGDDLIDLDLPAVGRLEPGATWQQTIRAKLPAPVLGRAVWQVTASGSGPAVEADLTTRHTPIPLFVLVVVLVVDVAAIVWRRMARRRLDADEQAGDAEHDDEHSDPTVGADDVHRSSEPSSISVHPVLTGHP